ncbi:hypothetical protein FLONG3_2049 [Fusarium longipes]|uniref:Uncharacterized protein n=1 Tax=Fusarium longipes TaxID=694270 RepID=A0A395T635_9HYPO|nr:hypothetical protein FLONG3_2049 [Fusarium longipes]
MSESIKSIKRKPTAKSAAKRIGRMFKRTNSEDPELTASMGTGSPKVSLEAPRPSTSSRFSISSRMTSRDDTETTPRGSKDQSRIFASWFDPATPKKETGSEKTAPPPLVSAYSEPILEHVKPVEPVIPVESIQPLQTEEPPFLAPLQSSKELKTKNSIPGKQIDPLWQSENRDVDTQHQPSSELPSPKASRPLPSPPVLKPVTYEPESPILPALDKEKPKQQLVHTSVDESKNTPRPATTHEHKNLAQSQSAAKVNLGAEPVKQRDNPLSKMKDAPNSPALPVQMPEPRIAPVGKSTMPRTTVEHDPELAKSAEAPKEQPRTKARSEAKVGLREEPRSTPPKTPQQETKSKAQLSILSQKNDSTLPVPEAIRRHAELKASPKASATPIIPEAPKMSSVQIPAPSSVHDSVTYTAEYSFPPSISFQPLRTVYFPDTAPAPKTARAPTTVRAPSIASSPEVVVSMLTRTAPIPAPVPSIASTPARAHCPQTSWIMSSA